MKNEKNYMGVFLYKFWSVSLEHFVEHKPLISEEWVPTHKIFKSATISLAYFAKKITYNNANKLSYASMHMYFYIKYAPHVIHSNSYTDTIYLLGGSID